MKLKYKILIFAFFSMIITSLWGNNIYLLFGFSTLSWLFIPQKKYWDRISISLLIFSLFYGFMAYINGKNNSYFILFSYIIAPATFYRFGRFLMNIFKKDTVRQLFLITSTILYLIYLFILTIKDIALIGIVNESRILLNNNSMMNSSMHGIGATMYGMMSSIGIGCIGTIFTKKQKLWIKLVYILISILSMLCVIHLVNRTGIIVFIACIVILFFISTKMNITNILKTLLLLLLLWFIIVQSGIINQDILDAYAQRENSEISNSGELGGRRNLWLLAIYDMFIYPFGWTSPYYNYAHNLWLDIARVGGLISLIPFIIATLQSLKNLFRLSYKKKLSNFAIIIISINIAMLFSVFVEPVIDGSLLYFCLLMMIWGITTSLVKEIYINKLNILYTNNINYSNSIKPI